MTDTQRAHCVKITTKLIKRPISLFFRAPVDPIADGLPDYFQKIKNPMDLGTVVEKLQHGQYATIEKWKEDIAQIWRNAAIFNGEGSTIDLLARELAELFRRYCEILPKTEMEAWLFKVRKAQQKVIQSLQCKVAESGPPVTGSAAGKKVGSGKILLKQKTKGTA
jgi:hypothetical protein